MQNSATSTSSNDQWFIDKYRGKGRNLNFAAVYYELRDLFTTLNAEINKQVCDSAAITDVVQKIASITNSTKEIIYSKESKHLNESLDRLMQHIKSLMSKLTEKLQKSNLQVGEFNHDIDMVDTLSRFLTETRLTYYDYGSQVKGALLVDEKPYVPIGTENIDRRKKLSRQERIRYFNIEGSQYFGIYGKIDAKTLGKYFVLGQPRGISSGGYMGAQEAEGREKLFHHYVGLCMLLQIVDQDYGDKTITLPSQKVITLTDYIDAFIDIDMLKTFTQVCIDSVFTKPSAAETTKAIMTFQDTYIEHVHKIILTMYS